MLLQISATPIVPTRRYLSVLLVCLMDNSCAKFKHPTKSIAALMCVGEGCGSYMKEVRHVILV